MSQMSNINAVSLTCVEPRDHNFIKPLDFAFSSRDASGFSFVALNTDDLSKILQCVACEVSIVLGLRKGAEQTASIPWLAD